MNSYENKKSRNSCEGQYNSFPPLLECVECYKFLISSRIFILFTSTGIHLFNIHAKKIHYALKIPLKYMK